MSRYLIYDIEEAAIDRELRVTVDANFNDGITTRYADLKKHPTEDKWALVIEKNYEQYFTQEELDASEELDQDWFNQPEINPIKELS